MCEADNNRPTPQDGPGQPEPSFPVLMTGEAKGTCNIHVHGYHLLFQEILGNLRHQDDRIQLLIDARVSHVALISLSENCPSDL